MKKIIISCGPIPINMGDEKYLISRFCAREAFSLSTMLLIGYQITIIKWEHTELTDPIKYSSSISVINVKDSFEYFHYIAENEYDAYILLAHTTVTHPDKGVSISDHSLTFDAHFIPVPRAEDIVKKNWPKSTLILGKTIEGPIDQSVINSGFTELFKTHSTAYIIDSGVKKSKTILLPDTSIHELSWVDHINMISRILRLQRYSTKVYSMTKVDEPIVKEMNFLLDRIKTPQYGHVFGTVAYKFGGTIISTTRGKRGNVWGKNMSVDHENLSLSGDQMTPNIPMIDLLFKTVPGHAVILHGHKMLASSKEQPVKTIPYYFDGTSETQDAVKDLSKEDRFINVRGHGYYALFETFSQAQDWLNGREIKEHKLEDL